MVGLPGASSDSAYTSGCMLVGTTSTVLKPAALSLSETQRAARSMSGLCSLLALTLGMRRNSQSSAGCCSWWSSMKSASVIGDHSRSADGLGTSKPKWEKAQHRGHRDGSATERAPRWEH